MMKKEIANYKDVLAMSKSYSSQSKITLQKNPSNHSKKDEKSDTIDHKEI